MEPNSAVTAAALSLDPQPVPDDQRVAGAPTTAAATVTEFDGLEIGVWEMTPGTMRDVEADEVFVVLSGSASVDFVDGGPALRLGPGDVVRLAAETQTVWTVHETLRKVYLTRP